MTSRTIRENNQVAALVARRNLFLSRRPPASSTATSATTTIQAAASEDTSEEIVVRDKNGEYQFEIPTMPATGQDEAMEKEREDARLAEAVKYHLRDRNRQPSEPAELLAAVQQNLRDIAASLREDNWMYEPEDDS